MNFIDFIKCTFLVGADDEDFRMQGEEIDVKYIKSDYVGFGAYL